MFTLTIPKVQAWERLHDPDYCGQLDTVGFYDLMREAGYSDDAAQIAASRRGWERLQAGVTM